MFKTNYDVLTYLEAKKAGLSTSDGVKAVILGSSIATSNPMLGFIFAKKYIEDNQPVKLPIKDIVMEQPLADQVSTKREKK